MISAVLVAGKGEPVCMKGETATAGLLLMPGSGGIMVNEVHRIPTDIGSRSLLTQGTVFLRVYHFAVLATDRILKTNNGSKILSDR